MNEANLAKKKTGFLSTYIRNPKERFRVVLTLTITLIGLIGSVGYILYAYQKSTLPTDHVVEGMTRTIGSDGRIGFFIALIIFPVFFLLKWKPMKTLTIGNQKIKPILQVISKYVRQWHVPIAILSTGLIITHGVLAIVNGFEWSFTYLSGITTMVVLATLLFMGFKRYKNADKRWHLKIAIAFLILFMIHSLLA